MDLIDPGVVSCSQWYPTGQATLWEEEPKEVDAFCGLARIHPGRGH